MLKQRTYLASLSVVLASAMAASAQAPLQMNRAGLSTARPLPSADSAIALLNKRVESVAWVDKPLEEVVDWFRDESGGNVDVIMRWTALSVESVDLDSLVTLNLRNATVAEVLQEVLDYLSEDGALGFHAWRNRLKISTRSDFDRKLYLRVYNTTDILFRVPDMGEDVPEIDLQQTASSSGGGGGGQSVFSGGSGGGGTEGGEQAEEEARERLDELATLIQDVVAPASWSTGQTGGRGVISVFNFSLVVLNTIEVHETIAGSFVFE